MVDFIVHTKESAPADSRPLLEGAERAYGFVPNLLGVLAEAPAALRAYLELSKALESTSLSPAERQVALLAVSYENGCEYCVAAHSAGARRVGVSPEVVDALRRGETLPDARLEAVRSFARAVVRARGYVADDDVGRFMDAGFGRAQILEVLVVVAMKTLSNYTNHIAGTELDGPLRDFAWEKPGRTGTAGRAA